MRQNDYYFSLCYSPDSTKHLLLRVGSFHPECKKKGIFMQNCCRNFWKSSHGLDTPNLCRDSQSDFCGRTHIEGTFVVEENQFHPSLSITSTALCSYHLQLSLFRRLEQLLLSRGCNGATQFWHEPSYFLPLSNSLDDINQTM